jgi:hypothetical protein
MGVDMTHNCEVDMTHNCKVDTTHNCKVYMTHNCKVDMTHNCKVYMTHNCKVCGQILSNALSLNTVLTFFRIWEIPDSTPRIIYPFPESLWIMSSFWMSLQVLSLFPNFHPFVSLDKKQEDGKARLRAELKGSLHWWYRQTLRFWLLCVCASTDFPSIPTFSVS